MELKNIIKEAVEEINIFLNILKEQKEVLQTYRERLASARVANGNVALDCVYEALSSDSEDSGSISPSVSVSPNLQPGRDHRATSLPSLALSPSEPKRRRRGRRTNRISNRLTELADRLIKKLEDREKGLLNLRFSAHGTAQSVGSLCLL